ncbi:type II toxin-antitoxin system HicA family toxin [Rhabdaerophilum calidifontis]|uniref:type II toxin-antitoxin system HicA family toxin n=1 Tax=Rhabdaerophilum calidifontis TaxID=2604328 RepID=UPI0012389CBD|nr:type II toxin-antitoxin system HicA family toxin [Rhabdaerophilum calidifontis]
MPSVPTSSRDIIRRLRTEGWKLLRIEGSHHHFGKPGLTLIITVPHPKKDLPIGTARRIAKIAGWV